MGRWRDRRNYKATAGAGIGTEGAQAANRSLRLRRPARCDSSTTQGREEIVMLWTIAVLLFLLWLGGMISNYTMGGFIHLLLLMAIASVLIRVIQGRRPV